MPWEFVRFKAPLVNNPVTPHPTSTTTSTPGPAPAVPGAPTAPTPSGDRCAALLADVEALLVAEGWTLDCAPPFPAIGGSDGATFPIWAWTDRTHHTVWIWEAPRSDPELVYLGWHELGHVKTGPDERTADGWAWCHHPVPAVVYLYRWTPTTAECSSILTTDGP